MNKFTDDDLKRLKEDAERDKRIGLASADRFIALLSRLEAAEKVAERYMGFPENHTRIDNTLIEDWRKAAGETI